MERRMIQAAEELSRQHMNAYNDPSHDWDVLHVVRVRQLALRIAKSNSNGAPVDMLVIELAALFHDLYDHKYANESIPCDIYERFFQEYIASGAISEDQVKLVGRICASVSYSKEVKRIKAGLQTQWHHDCLELHCVQDADKLDAMGAIGIMRCAAYSAVRNRPLVEPGNPNDALAHFEEKLLNLKDMMQTVEGKRLATTRHQFTLVSNPSLSPLAKFDQGQKYISQVNNTLMTKSSSNSFIVRLKE